MGARRGSNRQQFHRYWRRAAYYTKSSPKQVLCSHLSTRIRARPDRFAPWLDRSTTPYRTNTAMGQQENTHCSNASRIDAGTIGFLFQCAICTCSSARRGREIIGSIDHLRSPGAHAPLRTHRPAGPFAERLAPSRPSLMIKSIDTFHEGQSNEISDAQSKLICVIEMRIAPTFRDTSKI